MARRAFGDDDRAEQLRFSCHIAQDADDHVHLVTDRNRRQPLEPGNAEPQRRVGPENDDSVGAVRMAGIRKPAAGQLGAHGAKHFGRRGPHRELDRTLVQRVLDRRRAHQRVADIDFAEQPGRDDAVQALQARRRVPGNRAWIDQAAGSTRPRRDEEFGGCQLVELADDAVACGACQAQRRDQRRHADDHAQHRQCHTPRPRKDAGQRFVEQVLCADARARHGSARRLRRCIGGRFAANFDDIARLRLGQCAIDDVHSAARAARHVLVMRDDRQGQPVRVEFREEIEDGGRTLGVQVAGGLVAEQQAGRADQRTCDGHALPLAARQLARQEVGPVCQPHPLDRRHRPLATATQRLVAVDLGQHDVFQHAAVRQQVERLEDEADAAASQAGPLVVGQTGRVDAVDEVSPAGRCVEATDDVQQGRLAGARRASDRQPVAAVKRQVDIHQRVHRRIGAVLPADAAQLEHLLWSFERRQLHFALAPLSSL